MALSSPTRNYTLRVLDGNHVDINSRGVQLVALGTTMEETAASLKKISEGTTQIADSVDTIREMAGEIDGDLSKAATRYSMTGETLKTYALALQEAHLAINPLIEEIETAHNAADSARSAASDAQGALTGMDTTWPWEEEPTEADRSRATTASSDAAAAATTATNNLNGLWEEFETAFGTWSEAYDGAVSGIEKAIDTAGNNDGFWENLSDFLDVLGYIITALAILALFLTGPIAAIVLAIVAVLTVISLIGHLAAAITGNGSWVDVIVDVVGLATFGLGAVAARSIAKGLLGSSMRTLTVGGRNAVQTAIRSTMKPAVRWNPIGNAVRNGAAFVRSRVQTIPAVFSRHNFARSVTGGSQRMADFMAFTAKVEQRFGSNPGVAAWLTQARAAAPSVGERVANAVQWGGLTVADISDKAANEFSRGYSDFKNTLTSPRWAQ
jgi:hypothetical protein